MAKALPKIEDQLMIVITLLPCLAAIFSAAVPKKLRMTYMQINIIADDFRLKAMRLISTLSRECDSCGVR